jgi:hypothetical protein
MCPFERYRLSSPEPRRLAHVHPSSPWSPPLLKTISSAHAIAACSGFLITSNRVGRAMIDRSCDKGRGTLARDSSARLDRRDARHPSEHANPNRGASPAGGLATEYLRGPTASVSRSTRCRPATRRPCLRSPQGPLPARPRIETCELNSCLRSYSTL